MRGIARVKRALGAILRRAAPILGYDVLERGYYSPIVDVRGLPAGLWAGPKSTPGLDLDPRRQIEFLERAIAPYIDEFSPPFEPNGSAGGFYLNNGYYGPVDAEVLYGMIRYAKPNRIVELGSGYSTLVILAAQRANEREGHTAGYRIFDPYPGDHLAVNAAELSMIEPVSATEVPLSEFDALEAGDVLFVDTTHTVKIACDVNYTLLEVLPRLRVGVIVHIHDIFLPWEYPRYWIQRLRRHWSEQYLLQAFLAFNQQYEILFGSHAVARAEPDRLERAIRSFTREAVEPSAQDPFPPPAAFWIRRVQKA
jgi:Methyltransferase domain